MIQTNELLIVAGAIIAIVVGFYWFFSTEIKTVYLTLKLWELEFITLFYTNDNLTLIKHVIENTSPSELTIKDVSLIGSKVGMIANIPFMVLFGYLSYNNLEKKSCTKISSYFKYANIKRVRTKNMAIYCSNGTC